MEPALCKCGLKPVERVCGATSKTPGKEFLACANSRESSCGLFVFRADLDYDDLCAVHDFPKKIAVRKSDGQRFAICIFCSQKKEQAKEAAGGGDGAQNAQIAQRLSELAAELEDVKANVAELQKSMLAIIAPGVPPATGAGAKRPRFPPAEDRPLNSPSGFRK